MLFVLGITLPWLTPDVPPTARDTWSRAPPLQEGWAVHHHSLGLEVSSPELGPPSLQGRRAGSPAGGSGGGWKLGSFPSAPKHPPVGGLPLARPWPQLLWKTCCSATRPKGEFQCGSFPTTGCSVGVSAAPPWLVLPAFLQRSLVLGLSRESSVLRVRPCFSVSHLRHSRRGWATVRAPQGMELQAA
uniref:Uncharacterized protein n=1 Tax=Pipistrellus kuhlii TaxID=59472 RepID=A0A7J7XUY0_PIPKU|nr:hypothetical protein mPipKuh1_010458 [Pipistrellus kuhlii]